MTINEIQREIIAEMAGLDDWLDKYEYLITQGKQLPSQAVEFRIDTNALPGCQSKVWITAQYQDNIMNFHADSDSQITRGILALLLRVLDHQSPAAIIQTDLFFIRDIGLSTNLSPSRANGLASIVKQLKSLAATYHEQRTSE